MFQYKIDVIEKLKEKGYNSTTIRKDKIIGQAMLQKLRNGEMVSLGVLNLLCKLLECQPADLIEYVPDEDV